MSRDVAIKRLLADHPSSAQTERFLREARVQGRLDHPAIPPVYELATDEQGRPFFVMKRLAGTTLAEIVKTRDPRFSRQRLLRAFSEVCNAVELAHSRGVIHRDLKPTNIMLGDFGEVYVLDWGVAKVTGDREIASIESANSEDVQATRPGTIVGTRPYLAPEQLVAGELDHRADVYALGCVLFEILTGQMLFESDLREAKRRPSERAPDQKIPPELDEICLEATTPEPASRTASAAELGAAVQRFLDGDRDIELRREVAQQHLARARDALAGPDTEERNRVAMKEAGRAIALDPTLGGAADIVGRLMLEPPREAPAELEREIEDDRRDEGRRHTRVALLGYLGYMALVPMLFLADTREPWYAYALLGLLAINVIVAVAALRWVDHPVRIVLVAVVNGALVLLTSRMFSPMLLAPGIAAVLAMGMIGNPVLRRDRFIVPTAVLLIVSVFAPLVAEWLGWISSTYTPIDYGVVLHGPAFVLSKPALLMAIYTISLVGVATLAARTRARAEEVSRRKLHVQAWRLRHLVETAPAG
jgi:serine/threonine-protein kinase